MLTLYGKVKKQPRLLLAVDKKALEKRVPEWSKEDRNVTAFQSKTSEYRSGL